MECSVYNRLSHSERKTGRIKKEIHQELTYKDMYASVDNLWSVLFTTGYLTQKGKPEDNRFPLAIPNMEIRNIFTTQIMDFFKENVPKNRAALNDHLSKIFLRWLNMY